jgi:hypothetical protein
LCFCKRRRRLRLLLDVWLRRLRNLLNTLVGLLFTPLLLALLLSSSLARIMKWCCWA